MRPKRKQKLFMVLGLVSLAAIAVGLTLYALRANINLFFSPIQIVAGDAPYERQIRAGGMVKEGSVARNPDSLDVEFTVTDYVEDVRVHYSGILPDLFREGQGVVVVGQLQRDGYIRADQVLARHDENYMPPEVSEALEAAGYSPADYQAKAAEVAERVEQREGASQN
ncbi:cytochrome c maturation protein CcmE [Halomonas sp. MCCC 1A17488]|uniref:Cytochrome c-type biogenesis protein CcmE n=1 Tax=Billgrantia sulfidoxydans TaxID=2733484 RepID=A0ABX7VZQ2_9GAMM|nr:MULTISPECIES: cytochrome c maturation protein CcmE [Halomonas]MCE8016666.1 cytochrome c maturation protein CcmE [Halomonas sp. MCCC 1A17488]MCG3239999.1 cytochrome c maturation protein CcmE [Halomonas sp. MCCC 1A17488]QPP50112.1 cytochrome c maturation protein CcmE [Halomonas sp. SS10-MC5]QTP53724.1 cytochrome c maturation protein CcmE [Halomonas sulfidoxydans]